MSYLARYDEHWFLAYPETRDGLFSLLSRREPKLAYPRFIQRSSERWICKSFRDKSLTVYTTLHRGGLWVGAPSWAYESTLERPLLRLITDGRTRIDVPDSEMIPMEMDRWLQHDPREEWFGTFAVDELGKIEGEIRYENFRL